MEVGVVKMQMQAPPKYWEMHGEETKLGYTHRKHKAQHKCKKVWEYMNIQIWGRENKAAGMHSKNTVTPPTTTMEEDREGSPNRSRGIGNCATTRTPHKEGHTKVGAGTENKAQWLGGEAGRRNGWGHG